MISFPSPFLLDLSNLSFPSDRSHLSFPIVLGRSQQRLRRQHNNDIRSTGQALIRQIRYQAIQHAQNQLTMSSPSETDDGLTPSKVGDGKEDTEKKEGRAKYTNLSNTMKPKHIASQQQQREQPTNVSADVSSVLSASVSSVGTVTSRERVAGNLRLLHMALSLERSTLPILEQACDASGKISMHAYRASSPESQTSISAISGKRSDPAGEQTDLTTRLSIPPIHIHQTHYLTTNEIIHALILDLNECHYAADNGEEIRGVLTYVRNHPLYEQFFKHVSVLEVSIDDAYSDVIEDKEHKYTCSIDRLYPYGWWERLPLGPWEIEGCQVDID